MPKSRKESFIFTLCMCGMMVLGMSAYNLAIHGGLSFSALAGGFPAGFIVAFILDVVVVGKVAKKAAFKLPITKERMWLLPIAISCCMVLGMVTFMSLFGLLMEAGLGNFGFQDYLRGWLTNFVMAIPLQLLVVRPISVKVLSSIQK